MQKRHYLSDILVGLLSGAAVVVLASVLLLRQNMAFGLNTAPLVSHLSSLTSGLVPSQTSSPAPATLSSSTSDVTANWAGYEAASGTYTAVSASWTVPSATDGGDSSAGDAAWIGIGGVDSTDLIQTGTQNSFDSAGNQQSSAFYELLPDSITPIDSLNISPGDKVSASITETGDGQWQIKMTDNTTGQSFSTTVDYDSSLSSAEWIEEEPSLSTGGEIPLDNFNSVTFSDASASDNGVSQSLASLSAQKVSLVNNQGDSLADISGISGSGFSVSRTSASSVADNSSYYSGGGLFRRGGRYRLFGG